MLSLREMNKGYMKSVCITSDNYMRIYNLKIKNFIKDNKIALLSSSTAMAISFPQVAFADTVSVSSMISTSMQTIVTDTISSIAAIAPIGITIFGAMFAWKKGIQFFKSVTK